MWNSLTGEITRKGLEQLFLQSGDWEWDLVVSRHGLESLPAVGQRAKVYVWLQHTEDQMKLFGFATVAERAVFLDLLRVNGVGPKLALKILSGVRHSELIGILESGDAARLSKVPGVGLKTAQKILLALEGKLVRMDEEQGPSPLNELIASLSEMGFERRTVEPVVRELANDPELAALDPSSRERWLFQRALTRLSTT